MPLYDVPTPKKTQTWRTATRTTKVVVPAFQPRLTQDEDLLELDHSVDKKLISLQVRKELLFITTDHVTCYFFQWLAAVYK